MILFTHRKKITLVWRILKISVLNIYHLLQNSHKKTHLLREDLLTSQVSTEKNSVNRNWLKHIELHLIESFLRFRVEILIKMFQMHLIKINHFRSGPITKQNCSPCKITSYSLLSAISIVMTPSPFVTLQLKKMFNIKQTNVFGIFTIKTQQKLCISEPKNQFSNINSLVFQCLSEKPGAVETLFSFQTKKRYWKIDNFIARKSYFVWLLACWSNRLSN